MKLAKKMLSVGLVLAMALSLSVGAMAVEEDGGTAAILRNQSGEETAYATLEAALTDAGSGSTVILTADYSLTEDATVPADVLLVVPYDETYSTGLQDSVVKKTGALGSAYVTLTVPSDCSLTVNGTLLVNGVAIGDSGMHEGVLDGDYGCIDLEGSLVVNGDLYARGIIDGSGSVSASDGSTVYQMFQIRDWRGGKASSSMALLATLRHVFPFNEYEVSNIRTEATYAYGSSLIGQCYIYANSAAHQSDVFLLGDGGLFELASENSYCVSTYDAASGQLDVATHGSVEIGGLSVNAGGTNLVSSRFICPVSKHIGITAAEGTLTVINDLKLLPGSYLSVGENATLTVSKNLYVYDADAYLAGFTYRAGAATEDAGLILNGTVSGSIYSSDSEMANITGSAYSVSGGSSRSIYEYIQDDGYKTVTFYRAAFTPVA